MMDYQMGRYPITEKRALNDTVVSFTLFCPEIAKKAAPGQFVQIRAEGFFLRRPISICEIGDETIRLVLEVRGAGTKEIAALKTGEEMDLIAPLGKGFSLLDPNSRAILVGGGIGTPPMLALARHYGQNAEAILGFRSRDAVILTEEFQSAGAAVSLCTDDGTAGTHGLVTGPLEAALKRQKPDIVYACGPKGMLAALAALTAEYGVRCEVSLEERMGCGVGACLCCACKTVKDGKAYMAHVCKDGPVFPAETVVFD